MTRADRARFWAKHLSRQRRGLLSRREYCAKHRLSVSSFGYWSRKGDMPGVEPTAPDSLAARLVPVELLAEDAPPPVCSFGDGKSGIQLHTGAVRIELAVGFDVPTLRRALEALGC
jgi:hypothetical protein